MAVRLLPRRALLHRLFQAPGVGIRRSAAARSVRGLAGGTGRVSIIAIRALPILTAALTVYLAVQLTRELGGGGFAQMLAGMATLLMPAYLLLGNTLTTSSFEPFCWTLVLYLAIRIVRAPASQAPRWWPALGVAVALGGYAKYSILFPVVGVAAGLLATAQRRLVCSPYALAALGLAVVLLAPNLAWQAWHGWPIVEVLRGDVAHRPAFQSGLALEYRNLASNTIAFTLEQLLYTNPMAAPVWIAGLVAPFRLAGLRELRFVTISYVAVFVIAAALGAKGYYIAGFYATLFAIGAVAIDAHCDLCPGDALWIARRRRTLRASARAAGVTRRHLDRVCQGAWLDGAGGFAAPSHSARLRRRVRLAAARARRRAGLPHAPPRRARSHCHLRRYLRRRRARSTFSVRATDCRPRSQVRITITYGGRTATTVRPSSPSARRASISCAASIAASCSRARRPTHTNGSSKDPRRSTSAGIRLPRFRSFGRTCAGMARRRHDDGHAGATYLRSHRGRHAPPLQP